MRHTYAKLGILVKSSRLVLNHAQAYSSLLHALLMVLCDEGLCEGHLAQGLILCTGQWMRRTPDGYWEK